MSLFAEDDEDPDELDELLEGDPLDDEEEIVELDDDEFDDQPD